MSHLNRSGVMRVARLSICSLFVLAFAASAKADEIYTYTGTLFSGTLTLAQALPASSPTSIQFPTVPGYTNVLSWSFTNGVVTWTNLNSNILGTLTTNSSSQIVQWTLNGGTAIVGSNTFQWYSSDVGCALHMLTCSDSIAENGATIAKSTTPGSWTMTATSTVPESSSLLLLCIGLASLMMVRRRLPAS
jgi:hypothetical protein